MKSTVYNWQYLQELQLWREFICGASPRLSISFDRQAIVIENQLPSLTVLWPGVPDDTKDFSSQFHDEDLFSMAEMDFLRADTEQLDADFDDHLFLYPGEE